MEKPAELFDRDREWAQLARFQGSSRAGAALAVVSGRRRQGKSVLLEAAARVSGGVYLPAVESTSAEALRQLGRQLGRATGSAGPLALGDWSQAVDVLLGLATQAPRLVVLDELPYLAQAAPELPSLLQAALGPGGPRSRVRLVLCGSSLTFMGGLLSGTAPLRGRASAELVVRPFDYRTAARFWGLDDPALALRVSAVVGGTPAYRREFVDDDAPAALADFDDWVVRAVLDPASPLLREGRYLLADDPEIRDRGLYASVLAAVATGRTTRGGIADHVGRAAADLSHALTVLEDGGWLRREDDALRAARPRYRIDEPLLAFHGAVLRPSWTALERGRGAQVWERARQTFASQVLGPHLEDLARTWTAEHAGPETLGGVPERVASGVVPDREQRTQHEVDVVAVAPGPTGRRVLAIGEVKTGSVLGERDLERLQRVRDMLQRRDDVDASGCRLLCFSGGGFTDGLRLGERQGDVVLVDLERLYRGS